MADGEKLKESCAQHLRHEKQNWRPFALPAFERLRSTLLRVARYTAVASNGDERGSVRVCLGGLQ